jgi:hypothetical protein
MKIEFPFGHDLPHPSPYSRRAAPDGLAFPDALAPSTARPGRTGKRTLDARALDAKRFSDAQCEALFEAVLIDDVLDPVTDLPDRITLDHDEEQLLDCFRICRQLWKTGVDHAELVELNRLLGRDHDLSPADRLRFKYTRAKFKHLRFAYALYGAKHRYPVILDWMTTAMGHLQDAFKNGEARAVKREVALAHAFLSRLPQALLTREIDNFAPTDTASFRRYVERQVVTLRGVLAKEQVTGHEFHATRKIISRQVSFYDSLRTIAPTEQSFRMSRALAAINGLMGDMHDTLIERRIAGTQDYHKEGFALPVEISGRLKALVERYPA